MDSDREHVLARLLTVLEVWAGARIQVGQVADVRVVLRRNGVELVTIARAALGPLASLGRDRQSLDAARIVAADGDRHGQPLTDTPIIPQIIPIVNKLG